MNGKKILLNSDIIKMSYMEIIKNITSKKLFVTFSGRQQGLASMTIFEFKNFLEQEFPSYDKIFCRDEKVKWYNHGLTDYTSDVRQTLSFLNNKINGYDEVVFIGASMGGYAAILFGSLLNVKTVIAFRPQTIISSLIDDYEQDFVDVKPFINKQTRYFIYGDSAISDPTDIHSIEHCRRLNKQDNINIIEIDNFDLKSYKDSGQLSNDFHKIEKE